MRRLLIQISLLVLCLLLIAVTQQSAPPATAGALGGPVHATGLYLRPSHSFQTKTFGVRARSQECQAIIRAHPSHGNAACFLVVAIQYQGKGVAPMLTGGGVLRGRGVSTAYASITVCLSAPTLSGRGDCYGTVQHCNFAVQNYFINPPPCFPAWDAKVSTEFQYNGRRAQRIWLDPSILAGYGFEVRPSHAFDLPKLNLGGGALAIGEKVRVVGTIPATRPVAVTHVLRLSVFPDGSARFTVH